MEIFLWTLDPDIAAVMIAAMVVGLVLTTKTFVKGFQGVRGARELKPFKPKGPGLIIREKVRRGSIPYVESKLVQVRMFVLEL